MWEIEFVVNILFIRPFSYFTEFPLLLNATKDIIRNSGLNGTDALKINESYGRFNSSTLYKKIKKIYKTLRSQDPSILE